jgi:hypothetical protein
MGVENLFLADAVLKELSGGGEGGRSRGGGWAERRVRKRESKE